ncbi:hypothetical protein Taro_011001 [Colocasia esculenta]|uniref:Uncharacterized protein n=1 Tax=Colocasia esculenta TaxID=4460 RepID=A0A843U9E3_COLES|nr:hypothetical protein [Colocasia esculenta]
MGVSLRSPASVASSGASHVPPIRDPTIDAHQVERAERDDDEDEDPRESDGDYHTHEEGNEEQE